MGEDEIRGTSEGSIDNLILNLGDLSLNVSNVLDNISSLVSESSTYFKGEAAETIRNKVVDIEAVMPIIKSNLESYRDDFVKIKNNHIGYIENFNTSEVEELQEKGGDYSGVV